MATFSGETSKQKRNRLNKRIAQLLISEREKMLNLECINNELKRCQEELDKMGDFP